jgi:hypothetical protein
MLIVGLSININIDLFTTLVFVGLFWCFAQFKASIERSKSIETKYDEETNKVLQSGKTKWELNLKSYFRGVFNGGED